MVAISATRHKMKLTLLRTTLFAILLVAAVVTAACAAPAAEEQDKDWRAGDEAELVRTSDRIVIARFVSEVLATVNETVDNAPGPDSQLLYRQFQVIETFKGTTDPEDILWVSFQPGAEGDLLNGNGQVHSFVEGDEYVLFLKGRLRPAYYPTDYGAVLWTGNGQPSIARLDSDSLVFYAGPTYPLPTPAAGGTPAAGDLSAAPFSIDMARLRELTS